MTTLQTINLGSYANDGTGDDLRTAFTKVNANFAALNSTAPISSGANLGSGTGIYATANSGVLDFKSLTSTGNSVTITSTSNTVNLESVTSLAHDTNPTLNHNLNLNGYAVTGGDIETTVYGYDNRISNNFLSLMIENNNLDIDLGSFTSPTGHEVLTKGYSWDFGSNMSSVNNHINFGYIANSTNLQDGSNHTLNLSGNLTTSGGYNLTANLTGNTSVTFPTGGTLATLGANLGMFATTISNQLRLTVSDSVGTGYLVFNNAPSFAGLVSTSTFGAAFSDGIAVDYSTGQGRISVGTSDGIGFYNGGVASNPIGAVSSNGIWSLPTLALSTAPSVSAAGTNQATATSLASSVNVITTVASGTGVALPANVTGMVIKVWNAGLNTLKIYPVNGNNGNINSSTSYSLSVNTGVTLTCVSSTQWYTM